jgi:hypothetical protein
MAGADIVCSPQIGRYNLEIQDAGGCLSLVHLHHCIGGTNIGHDPQPAQIGDNITQEFKALTGSIGYLGRQAGDIGTRSGQTLD